MPFPMATIQHFNVTAGGTHDIVMTFAQNTVASAAMMALTVQGLTNMAETNTFGQGNGTSNNPDSGAIGVDFANQYVQAVVVLTTSTAGTTGTWQNNFIPGQGDVGTTGASGGHDTLASEGYMILCNFNTNNTIDAAKTGATNTNWQVYVQGFN